MYKYLLNLILWLGALSSINACMVTDDEKTATSDQSSNIISVDKNAQSKQDLDEIHNLILHSALAKEFEKLTQYIDVSKYPILNKTLQNTKNSKLFIRKNEIGKDKKRLSNEEIDNLYYNTFLSSINFETEMGAFTNELQLILKKITDDNHSEEFPKIEKIYTNLRHLFMPRDTIPVDEKTIKKQFVKLYKQLKEAHFKFDKNDSPINQSINEKCLNASTSYVFGQTQVDLYDSFYSSDCINLMNSFFISDEKSEYHCENIKKRKGFVEASFDLRKGCYCALVEQGSKIPACKPLFSQIKSYIQDYIDYAKKRVEEEQLEFKKYMQN